MESEEEKEVRDAERAKELLEDPLLQGSLDKMEDPSRPPFYPGVFHHPLRSRKCTVLG